MENIYKCRECETEGPHNLELDIESMNENGWGLFWASLTCSQCGIQDSISGNYDEGSEVHKDNNWTFFEVIEEVIIDLYADYEHAQATEEERLELEREQRAYEESLNTVLSPEEKGKIGEQEFNNWLKEVGISYIYIEQSKETLSTLFRGNVKRPDFLMLLESVGMLAIDVKNKDLYQERYFSLGYEKEFLDAVAFERLFRMPLWYAYKSPYDDGAWYWISALKVIEVGKQMITNKNGKKLKFLNIDIEHFERIEKNDDLSKLYTHRLPSTQRVVEHLLT